MIDVDRRGKQLYRESKRLYEKEGTMKITLTLALLLGSLAAGALVSRSKRLRSLLCKTRPIHSRDFVAGLDSGKTKLDLKQNKA